MPISPITLQRRQAELGRIRLGQQVTSNGKTRPAKLEKFRFTSVSEQYIQDLAKLYGGTARQWDNNGIPSWEVITTATSIPVIVVKGGLSQWMETWSGGGCTHRCDGQQQVDGTVCNPDDPAHIQAKPTTRLSVMLPELEAIGVFRMESHGWNAAAEIPAVAELAQFVGDLVPAVLHLVERRAIKDGKTSRFVVPVLDLQIGAAKLREIVEAHSGAGMELEAPATSGAAAIGAGTTPDYLAQAKKAQSTDQINEIWKTANDAGHMTDDLYAELKRLGAALKGEPAVEGEIELDPPDVLWQRCLSAAGKIGLDLPALEAKLASDYDVTPAEATSADLDALLTSLESEAA